MLYKRICLSVLLFVICSFSEHGMASDDVPGAFIQIIPSARWLRVGGAAVSQVNDVASPIINPAGLVHVKKNEIGAMFIPTLHGVENLSYGSVGYAKSLSEYGAIGLTWTRLDAGNIQITDKTGGIIKSSSQSENVFSVSYANSILDKQLAFGGNICYLKAGEIFESNGLRADIGVQASLPLTSLSEDEFKAIFGVTAHQIVGKYFTSDNGETYDLPRDVRAGVAVIVMDKYTVSAELDNITIPDYRIGRLGAEAALIQVRLENGAVEDILRLGAGLQTSSGKLSWSAGVGISLPPEFGIGLPESLEIDYVYMDGYYLPGSHVISARFPFGYIVPQPPIEIKDTTMDEIFASLYHYYLKYPIGKIKVENKSSNPIPRAKIIVNIPFQVKISSTQEKKSLSTKSHSETYSIRRGPAEYDLYADFSEDAFLSLHRDTDVDVDIKIRYKWKNKPQTAIPPKVPKLQIYELGAIAWQKGIAQAAAFITEDDDIVKAFADHIDKYYKLENESQLINIEGISADNLLKAIKVYNTLKQYGINYRKDPTTPYEEASQKDVTDAIQYPREFLDRDHKTGDCDDLTVLYASLLENLGIHTALAGTPGHLFMMFDAGAVIKLDSQSDKEQIIIVPKSQKYWIPVDVATIDTFPQAWKKGGEYYQEHKGIDFEMVDVSKARAQGYKPITVKMPVTLSPTMPDKGAVMEGVKSDIEIIKEWKPIIIEEKKEKDE